eukprot:TRINITY_DN7660_c0_g1_i1.p1 TRINITY_DN7660_c0_g1~~TRINITY_DN7660_c0_g1_i1.p1  ORF type:complete len:412 (+),score=147.59 TRINITY_DN7660_c0_g1_i1:60-1238(+)
MAAFIVGAKRTAFGAFGGKFLKHSANQLGALASIAALKSANVDPSIVDSVVWGNVQQTSLDAPYISRHIGLNAGVPIERPALTINRLCGSGFQSVVNAVQEIRCGDANIVLTGGSENMSQAPFSLFDSRFGTRFGQDPPFKDTLWNCLTDAYIKTPMAITAENLGEKYGISREECDAFALRSQQRWAAAQEAGVFKSEIVPVELKGRKGPESFEVDEHARPQTTPDSLAKLPAVFKKDGVVTAGNASGICDGGSAVVVASEAAVQEHSLKPLARIVSWGIAGVDPNIMGIGPVPAIKIALERASLSLDQMDVVEVNEAFSVQALSVQRELGIPDEKLNVNGGAVALGHPLAASGSRILAHLAHELQRTGKQFAVGSACIGGGQGIAVIIERV